MKKSILFLICLASVAILMSCNQGEDNATPQIIGARDLNILCNQSIDFMDGITAYDEQDGDLSNSVVLDLGLFDNNVPGVYTVTYSLTDSDGFKDEVSISVTVEPGVIFSIQGEQDTQITDLKEYNDQLYGVGYSYSQQGDFINTVSSRSTAFIFKVNHDGSSDIKLLDKNFDITVFEQMIITDDGRILVLGSASNTTSNIIENTIYEYDITLNLINEHDYSPNYTFRGMRFTMNNQGEIGIVGQNFDYFPEHNQFILLDNSFNITYELSIDNNNIIYLNDIISNGSDFMMVGSTSDNFYEGPELTPASFMDVFLLKVSKNQGVIFEKTIKRDNFDQLLFVKQMSEDVFVSIGTKDDSGDQPFLISFDSEGNIMENMNIPTTLEPSIPVEISGFTCTDSACLIGVSGSIISMSDAYQFTDVNINIPDRIGTLTPYLLNGDLYTTINYAGDLYDFYNQNTIKTSMGRNVYTIAFGDVWELLNQN